MRIETNEHGDITLKEVYAGLGLESNAGERFSICMRDNGFEFNYGGKWYSAQNGFVRKMDNNNLISTDEDIPCVPVEK